MPRIVPLQLLKCLKVLLDDNGGILSIGEVKRIAGLMNRYSKKLVSKCIYVQILKVTKTELLGEFMGVGGWSLVYNWLNDAIRAMNWPLVQEILELLLLCPVDVDRLKINSAPKLVKGLCRDGGNEGVRILAKRLVEQWLKVVTENTTSAQVENAQQQTITNVPAAASVQTTPVVRQEPKIIPPPAEPIKIKAPVVSVRQSSNIVEEDPLADVADVPTETSSYTPTSAQKKANEAGLVFKLVIKDGQQVLAKVPKTAQVTPTVVHEEENERDNVEEEVEDEAEAEAENAEGEVEVDHDAEGDVEAEPENEEQEVEEEVDSGAAATVVEEEEETRTSLDKPDKESESSADDETRTPPYNDKVDVVEKSSDRKKSIDSEGDKSEIKEAKSSKEGRESKNKEKEQKVDKDREKDRKSSSSSHKSSSHKSKTSSSSSKSKSSSSSSSHRSSGDKHRSDKERSSSSKDKDRKEGSSSNKHKSSSSSSKSSSSTSSKDKHRDKDKDKSSNSSSSSISTTTSHKKDKEREKEIQAEKDKDTISKLTQPSIDKLGRIPKKPKDESESETVKPASITIPSKKASMSIEIRRDSDKTKTVKTYKSQFRSHGLTEEAPPPPSRKGLKKPISIASAPGTVIPASLPSSLKRPSPPPSSSDSPTQKKSKIDMNNLSVANEKPGAIKLIAPKKIQTLVETNLFSDALSAATGPKKITKRKRSTTPAPGGQTKEGPSPPTSPDGPKVAPLKFYQDTLDESKSDEKSDKENDVKEQNSKTEDLDAADKGNSTEDDDDIPLKKVKEDIEQKVLREQKAADDGDVTPSTASGSVDITGSDAEEDAATKEAKTDVVEEEEARKPPGPGCGPNGPPGVLMLHRRKGPKKKLTWRTQEHLEQIRYFELDENERVNVTKAQSFMDMKNLERYSERDAFNIARRGFTHDDNMRPQTEWRPLIEVDGVPPHPNGNQSKQRKVQADRELTTLRALYFSHSMIPDSPAEAELEPHFAYDVPVIPLEDITGNPDAVSDYTNMPWPEPKGSPKYPENNIANNTAKLTNAQVNASLPPNNVNAFPAFMPQYAAASANNMHASQMQMPRPVPGVATAAAAAVAAAAVAAAAVSAGSHPAWQGGNFNGPLAAIGGPSVAQQQQNLLGAFGPAAGNPQWQMHGGQYGPAQGPFNNGPNFGPMGMMAPRVMANMAAANIFERNNMNNSHHNNNQNRNHNSGNWRTGSNFQDNSGSGGNWRSGGGGQNRGGGGGGNNNNGVCKAYMRGHCRLGKSCKFIHPKSKRI
ncbi:serine/threonine-protein phosphatase 1 regulatory subunit 10 [Rhagoletis pomonella]|uniref:serine/threonine-protein phosphatase 1 regulatory subunit 10 n=1 Tax=Rhagoletis pomonella TaxID=28610 RepID=UPI0017802C5B|nr:serine/threonine-protein phosphatase 1 regulatory subunit 10 [Rhagoletis pomonella]XP_036328574.1 serine/threonine-protein phosphatase 1 regulatory subunit 10 [Rhagoletis pomonella]